LLIFKAVWRTFTWFTPFGIATRESMIMKRRYFLAALGPLAMTPIALTVNAGESSDDPRQYMEWIHFTLPGRRDRQVEKYFEDAAIPALNRLGIKDIGVFSVLYGPSAPSLYVLIPHDSAASVMSYQEKLLDDGEYAKAAKAYHESSITTPAFKHFERGLMRAFIGIPRVESPKEALGNERIFELRIYQSHNFLKGQKKIKMFNEGGELQIFRDTGLRPVFFGETLFGPLMPNLAYMLAFKDMADRDSNWDKFRVDPRWDTLRNLEEYKDTVSNITDFILRPAGCSQV
jgi:hypothetical protein